jgi:YidC/Oxa1 family membrane protein insertase
LLDPLYTAISWVMAQWHALWNFLFADPPVSSTLGGLTWVLAIVFLVVTVRLILFPLFVKQVKSQRAMQELQPEIAKLRKQYGSDRQGMSQAMMALQKERGVNPLAGCLPILPQIPVFLSLFHVLRRLQPGAEGLYGWSNQLTDEAARAKFFGAPISSSFNMTGAKQDAILAIPGVTYLNIRIVAMVLIVIMCATTFLTQKQIQKRSGPVEGQAATVQKILLYVMPAGLFVSGFLFPIGVLLYWFTNNLWTLGQQFFILRKMPPPGSPAANAKAAEDRPDPRTLAPKPGAKPVRPKPGRPATAPAADGAPSVTDAVPPADGGSANGVHPGGSAGGSSRAGQTPPNRGKRKRR